MNKAWVRTARPVAKLQSGRNDWYRIVNAATADTSEVYIYDEIGYWGVTAGDFVAAYTAITTPNIDLHLNSPGGEVYDGIAIHTAIGQHPATTTVYVDGLAASAASFIAMAGDKVVMARNAELMIHDAMGLVIGNAADMRSMVDDLDRISDNIASMYADKAGGDVADWRALMLAETWYSAQEAVDAGLADEIAGQTADDGQADNSFDLSVFRYAARAQAPAPPTPPADEPPVFQFDPEAFRSAIREAVHP
jgi:ATP-dependent protease ClpP protease subunit